jgi:hypothetical protein
MTKQTKEERLSRDPGQPAKSALESGVIFRGDIDQPEGQPPWSAVREYVLYGEHSAWVEGWAMRSPAFADVLEALRHDQEERYAARRAAVVVPLRGGGRVG